MKYDSDVLYALKSVGIISDILYQGEITLDEIIKFLEKDDTYMDFKESMRVLFSEKELFDILEKYDLDDFNEARVVLGLPKYEK